MNKGCYSKLKQKYKISKNKHFKTRDLQENYKILSKNLKISKVYIQILNHYGVYLKLT